MAGFQSGSSILGQIGQDTDIGGGRENQDDCFVCTAEDVIIMCVLDGHGREVGKCAANTARGKLLEYFREGACATMAAARGTAEEGKVAYDCLVNAHAVAHFAIKAAFRDKLEQQGLEVQEGEGGYLMKKRPGDRDWSCVHGGSSCSVVAIVGSKCYIANVGDSSGILCGYHKSYVQEMVTPLGDAAKRGMMSPEEVRAAAAAAAAAAAGSSNNITNNSDMDTEDKAAAAPSSSSRLDTVMLTADHSPDSPDEYRRLRAFRASEDDPRHPALKVVYDSPTSDKTCCPAVFTLDAQGEPHVTNDGRYYKNVRQEWASLVSTPSRAMFQDALAFTRSLGDLHLHTYGVTHEPEVQCLDLNLIWQQQAATLLGGEDVIEANANKMFCIVLATDGVWDNWAYEDVTRFVMDSSCVQAVMQAPDGAQRVAQSFMQRNAVYARRNFGGQADNATGIVGYFSMSHVFAPSVST